MTNLHYNKIGVLMLDTKFPRLLGDIGNPKSFDCEVIYQIVKGASPHKVVERQDKDLLQPFIQAGKELVLNGAELITTSCGFLIYFQKELQAALSVPVITSSLVMFQKLEQKYGHGHVGILTISDDALTSDILGKANIPLDVPVGSTQGGQEFTNAILENRDDFDIRLCEIDNVNAAQRLQELNPNLKAILLECTNMPPHANAIAKATNLEVYSIMDSVK